MFDNRKLIVRKAKDGINHEAVLMDYCAGWIESEIGSGYTEKDAITDLINTLRVSINMLESDLHFVLKADVEYTLDDD